ncbi:hypothetical protein [Streptomyces graminilatus]|uniref:hypothetical protein n=1 Tax=Streptomyces graminilatus TaxID=1464070 RepID=UPI0006E20335|nr:hypothetical protein [Streptomyces graminilatus]
MSSARRSLLTATAAGTLLGALWFVPSANATAEKPAVQPVEQRHRAGTSMSSMSEHTQRISLTGTRATNASVSTSTSTSVGSATATTATTTSDTGTGAADGTRLADTGSFNTTPYVVGGTFCLGLGAGFVAYSLRRERLEL